jgi:pimeloyl-ACP methyl ester carboxylesterase
VRPTNRVLAAIFLACAWICASVVPAHAQIAFAPCGDSNDFACGHLTVPLDPSGSTPGTITLALRRHRAPVGEAKSAIIALAGGPGQPALPFAEQFAEVLGPIADTRDLIAFDERGIGLSQPLSCHAFERPDLYRSFGSLIAACGSQLGPSRVFYTTADTVADIEAIRVAGGYEKLVLYGTSNGTKVAEQYAQDYPEHVEALILDSVLTPTGPEPLERATFEAIPRVLRQICAARACAHVTPDPVADLAKVVRRMQRGPLRARVIEGDGKGHAASISPNDLLALLLAGDFSPLLRAEFVTTVRSAASGDVAPLARLLADLQHGEGEGEREDFDNPLYFATNCEEEQFPWSRAASPGQRIAQALAAARALPANALAPFGPNDAIALSDIPACAYWPYTTPAPPIDDAPLPDVPTLILSGADDLRTPTAGAREVAAQIPGSHLLVVPYTGHSVLSDEPTPCAREALEAMFAPAGVGASPIKSCAPAPAPPALRPIAPAPVRLGTVAPSGGYRGLPGRTLHAVALTLQDFIRQLTLRLGTGSTAEAPALSIGGLRAGSGQVAGGALHLDGYSYVPGVSLSGTLRSESAQLQIGGAAAAHGTLRLGGRATLVGTLGGRHVRLNLSGPAASAAIVDADAQQSSNRADGSSVVRADLRSLAGLLGRIFKP